MDNKNIIPSIRRPYFIYVGIGLGLLFWTLESGIYSFVLNKGSFVRHLFYVDLHELVIRLLVPVLIIAFATYARFLYVRCRRAEETVRRVLGFETAVSSISTRFTGAPDIDEAINVSLGEMGRLSGANRVYLFLFRENGILMDNTHEWCAPGIKAEKDNLRNLSTDMFPWWMNKLRHGETIYISNVSLMPAEARTEKEILERQHIKSLIVLPVYIKKELNGFIGFDNVIRIKDWSEQDLAILRIVSEIVSNALTRQQTTKELQESKTRFRTIFDNAKDGISVVNLETKRFHMVNKTFYRMIGYSSQEIKTMGIMDIHPQQDLSSIMEQFEKQARKETSLVRDIAVKRKDNSVFYADINSTIIKLDGQTYLMGIFRDVSERRRIQETLRQLSLLDELTKLYNRRGFITLAQEQLLLANRTKKELVLLFADVDDLKNINDKFGHQEGDRALIETAYILKDTFRKSDIIARVGGDEFVVLAVDTPVARIGIPVEHLQKNFKTHNAREGRAYQLSISIGTTIYDPQHPLSVDELLSQADKLMYRDKNNKKHPPQTDTTDVQSFA